MKKYLLALASMFVFHSSQAAAKSLPTVSEGIVYSVTLPSCKTETLSRDIYSNSLYGTGAAIVLFESYARYNLCTTGSVLLPAIVVERCFRGRHEDCAAIPVTIDGQRWYAILTKWQARR